MDYSYPVSSGLGTTLIHTTANPIAPSSVNPSNRQVSIPCNILTLPLDHFQSRDYFQQILTIESTLESLATAKQKLLADEHDLHIPSPEREDEIRGAGINNPTILGRLEFVQSDKHEDELGPIRQSVTSLDTLTKTFKELLETARRNHTHSAHLSLQGKTWKFPNEILYMIFNNLRPLVNTRTKQFSLAEDEHDIATIHAIRLTCKQFNKASSHLLVRQLTVSPNKTSIARLERVMRDQSTRRTNQILKIDMRCYSATLANNFKAFANVCSERLDNKVQYFDDLLLDLGSDLDEDALKMAELKRTAQRREELQLGWLSRDTINDSIEQGRHISSSCQHTIHHHRDIKKLADGDEAIRALWKGYQQYHELWDEEQEFLWSDQFARRVATAAAATGSKIWLSMSDGRYSHWDLAGYDTSRQFDEHGLSDLNVFADPVKLVEHIMLRPRPWWLAERDDRRQLPPRSLLYQLPLALRAAGAEIAGLSMDLTKWPLWPFNAILRPTGDHLLHMEQTINDPSVVCSFRLSRSPGFTRPGWLERHGYRLDSDDMVNVRRLDDPGLLSLFYQHSQATFCIRILE